MRSLVALGMAALLGCTSASAPPPSPSRPPAAQPLPPEANPLPPPAIRGPEGQIRLRTLEGRPTTLGAYGARVTVIALWATYCAPCLDELPYIEALHERYRGRSDVSVITVNLDDTGDPAMRDEVRRILAHLAIDDTPNLLDGMPVMERVTERDETGAPRMAVPLLVVVDPAFRLHRRFGFLRGMSRDEYLDEKSALIEAALRGDEPDDPSPPAL